MLSKLLQAIKAHVKAWRPLSEHQHQHQITPPCVLLLCSWFSFLLVLLVVLDFVSAVLDRSCQFYPWLTAKPLRLHTTMYVVPDGRKYHITIAQPIVEVNAGDATMGFKTALAVEVPLMVLALSTVILRVYSRLAIKRKIAPDDILIMLGTVCRS